MKSIKLSHYTFLIFLLILGLTSCKKDNNCKAGSGGNVTIIAKLKHHGAIIPNDSLRPDTVWIKYNAQDWSNAPSGSNAMFIGTTGEDHVHISGLKCGDYYFYASGWDTFINEVVTGGRPFSTENNDGELNVDIAVTE